MSPQYIDGDYVLSLRLLPIFLIKEGKDFIISHPKYGMMIKKLESKSILNDQYQFTGLNIMSVTQQEIGVLPKTAINSLVLFRVRK